MKKSLMQLYLEEQIRESRPEPPAPSATGLDRCVIRPGEPIPADYLDVLKSWKAFREHPAWKNHPQLK